MSTKGGMPSTPKEAFKSIRILFLGITIGMFLFTIVAIIMNRLLQPSIENKEVIRVFLLIALFGGAGLLSTAGYIYKKRITQLKDLNTDLLNRLSQYRATIALYLALCEAAGLLAVIFYFISGTKLFLIVTAISLIAMILKRPEKSKIFNELQLNTAEQMELN